MANKEWKWVKDGSENRLVRESYWGTEKKTDIIDVNSEINRIMGIRDSAGTRMIMKRANPKPKIMESVDKDDVRRNARRHLTLS